MQGFEGMVGEILEAEGFWVRRTFRVGLTKAEKREIGRPSAPRWEIDLLAYRSPENLVLVVECKSYLDSPGVDLADLNGGRYSKRYKLFTEPSLRNVIFRRLGSDLVENRLCSPNPTIRLALAAGRLKSDPASLRAHFDKNGWLLFDPEWVRERLKATAAGAYTDSVAAMTAKLLLRQPGRQRTDDTG